MAEKFAGGHLRYQRGSWRDDDGDTVDAVEVVRCKDCKHWHKETGWCYHHSHFVTPEGEACHPWESANWKMFDDNDFCSYGERRVDDGK